VSLILHFLIFFVLKYFNFNFKIKKIAVCLLVSRGKTFLAHCLIMAVKSQYQLQYTKLECVEPNSWQNGTTVSGVLLAIMHSGLSNM
jgi:hypothetical protein